MEVFIHEDYVNKRREQRRRQLQMLQVEANPDASRQVALAGRESPRVPAQCLTPTGASPSSGARSPMASALSPAAAAAGEAAGWPSEHRRLFDSLKPY
ncbi:unnamed protein product [Urochloa decumbens]|uniref:Uncharacterized protein n=1 Tax=Urochloa decumbens TaxID=240449 RepID=A0ABC9C9U6_9POAL